MNVTLSDLLENLHPGMLWLSRDGLVRFAHRQATAKLRLGTGARVQEPTLINAVNGTVIEQSARTVTISGQPAGSGEPVPELRCKALPGLLRDDEMVPVTDSADEHAAVGFDNLMMVIRSDLRDSLRELNSALVMARNERDVHALDALCDQVDEVRHVLHKLIDLAAVSGSESLLTNDRIELWPLLQQAWAKAEPLARARNLKARFTAQGPKTQLAAIYGSEHWLQRVFIDLPTGAPFRSEATAMDIALAQVYAKDLAAPMARRRDAHPAQATPPDSPERYAP